MKIQFIRHATYILSVENKKKYSWIQCSGVGELPTVALSLRKIKNSLISLPVGKNDLIKDIDAVLLTHCHFDHFDREASKILPKNTLFFCQPGDDKD